MHTLLVSYLYLGSLFHTIEHKFCGLSTGLRFCVKATKFYYYYYYLSQGQGFKINLIKINCLSKPGPGF